MSRSGIVGCPALTIGQKPRRWVAHLTGPETSGYDLQIIESVWIGGDGHLCALNGDAYQEVRPSVHVLAVGLAGELVAEGGIVIALRRELTVG